MAAVEVFGRDAIEEARRWDAELGGEERVGVAARLAKRREAAGVSTRTIGLRMPRMPHMPQKPT